MSLHGEHQLPLDWAWEHLPVRKLWALVRWLPPESPWQRLGGASTALEENVASLLDFLAHDVFAEYRRNTFDPERWSEHKAELVAAKRSTSPPPQLPEIVPIALRPAGAKPLPVALTAPPESAPVEEVHGHEAHVRLQAVLNAQT